MGLRGAIGQLRGLFANRQALGTSLKPHRQRLQRYIRGRGIEIGALHNPMPVDRSLTTVRYVDHLSLEGMRAHYPELAGYDMVEPEIISAADHLPMLDDGTEDFVIANHLLEHIQDPIGALKEWHRILRPGGILFLALPDKRLTFDKDRPRTPLAHLIEDHKDGGASSRAAHYAEYSRLVHKKVGAELARDTADLMSRGYSIHFHVWVPEDIRALLDYLPDAFGVRWETVEQVDSTGSDEFIFILRKPA